MKTPIGKAYIEKLTREHPEFRERLGRKHFIAGWSHNPWQDDNRADARATETAKRYLGYMTESFGKLGYLPYVGAEVNVPLISDDPLAPQHMVDHIHGLYGKMHKLAREHYPDDYPTPHIDAKLSREDEVQGRIYKDVDEVEVATPAQSPLATVARVNAIKRVFYEGSHYYAVDFVRSLGKQGNHDQPIPSGPAAQILANGVEPYNIRFSKKNASTGEHISFSLVRHTLQPGMDYSNAKHDMDVFSAANLCTTPGWSELLRQAYLRYLPHDSLLSFGNPYAWSTFRNGGIHEIRVKHLGSMEGHRWQVETEGACRVEVRSFNDASSNIALSMLAITAIPLALIKTIHDDPELCDRYGQGTNTITAADGERILQLMHKKYMPDIRPPTSLGEAKDRFNNSSLTLRVMQEMAIERAMDPKDKSSMFEQLEQFKADLAKRAGDITRISRVALAM